MLGMYPSVNHHTCHGDHRRCPGCHLHGYHDCLHGDDDDGACDAGFLSSSPILYRHGNRMEWYGNVLYEINNTNKP